MYFNSSLVHVDILVLNLKLEVQYLGHNSWERIFILGEKNGANQTLRSLESQNHLFTIIHRR